MIRTKATTITATVALVLGVFIFDLVTPLGYEPYILYLIPLFIASRGLSRQKILLLSAICTVLIVLGFFLSPPGSRLVALFNFSLGIVVLWITAYLIIYRNRAEEILKEGKELSDILNTINAEIHSTLDFEGIIRKIAVDATQAVRAEASLIGLFEGDNLVIKHAYNIPEELIGPFIPLKELDSTRYAAELKDVVTFNDAFNDGRLNRARIKKIGIRSLMIAPLIVGGDMIGMLYFAHLKALVAFSDIQIDFARKLSASVALSLENARLYQERIRSEEKLIERDLQRRAILDNIPDMAWLKDKESRFIVVNEAFGKACGRNPAELPGKTDLDVWPEDLAQKYRTDDIEVMKTRVRKRVEERLMDKYGKERWIETIKMPTYNDRGKVTGTTGIARDFTERKRSEEALRQSERLRQLVMDAVPALMSYVDRDLRYQYVNRPYEEWFSRPASEISGKHVIDMLGEEMFSSVQGYLKRVLSGERVAYEMSVVHDGENRYVQVNHIPHIGDENIVLGFFTLVSDITERKYIEKHLQDANERIKDTLDSITEAYFVLDSQWRFAEINKEAERLYGADLIGKVYWEKYPQHIGREFDRQYHRAVEERHPVHFEEFSLVTNRWYEVHAYPRGDRLEIYFHDITTRKEAEEAIAKLNQDLQRRASELERAYKDMESFSYAVSHDLKAPARRIRDFSRTVLEDYAAKLDEPGRRILNRIEANAESMGNLIDDLLSFTRVTTIGVRKSEIDMEALAKNVYEELKPGIGEREVKIEIGKLPPAYGDSSMIHQVLLNLLSNSLKFTRTRATANIEVGGYVEKDETAYYVQDNGIGFDMQFADKLFGLFQRIHSDKEFEGTGVGLVIVKKIVEKHGGRAWAEGRVNEGAKFYFSLPKE